MHPFASVVLPAPVPCFPTTHTLLHPLDISCVPATLPNLPLGQSVQASDSVAWPVSDPYLPAEHVSGHPSSSVAAPRLDEPNLPRGHLSHNLQLILNGR